MFTTRKIAVLAAAGLTPLIVSPPLLAYAPSGQVLTGLLAAAPLQAADDAQPDLKTAEVQREYDLNPEKADALFELLAPGDVKVMVSRRDGGVLITGTSKEAKVFDAFVAILTRHNDRAVKDTDAFIEEMRPTWDTKETYKLPQPKADALYRILAISNVPVLVSRADSGVTVEASKADQQVIANVIRVVKGQRLESKPKAQAAKPEPDRPRRAKRPAPPAAPKPDQQGKLEDMVERLDAKRKELEQRVDELARHAQHLARAVDELGAKIEQEAQRFAEEIQQPVAPPPPPAPRKPDRGGEIIVREYSLPTVHAQNLFNLLAPSDIRDVIVSRRDDVVEIRADAHDHETIARLVDILTRGSKSSAAR